MIIDETTIIEILESKEEESEKTALKEGIVKGERSRALKVAKAMLEDGVSLEKISQYTDLPTEEIEKLK